MRLVCLYWDNFKIFLFLYIVFWKMSISMNKQGELFSPYDIEPGESSSLLEQRLRPRSLTKYEKVYEDFMRWKLDHNAYSMSEDVFQAYFRELAKVKRSSTLLCFYSMLKHVIRFKHNLDIGNFKNLLTFLKSTSNGFTPTITKVLTESNIRKFLKEAPEPQYLLAKVVLILGICGGCRNIEITSLTLDDMEIYSDKIIVHLKCSNRKMSRTFAVEGELLKYFRRYLKMRPVDVPTNRFLLNIRRGKCITQVVGVNRIGKYPKEIAKYLGLSNAESYLGTCFRRSSTTMWWLGTPSQRACQRLGYLLKQRAGDCMEDSMDIETNRIRRSDTRDDEEEEDIEEDNVPLVTLKTLEKGAKLCNNGSMGHNAERKIEAEGFREGDDDESKKTKKSSEKEADKYFNVPLMTEMATNQGIPQHSTATPTEPSASMASQNVQRFNLVGKTIHVTFNNCTDCNVIFELKK